MVQTRSQAKTQTNTPSVQSTKPVIQKATLTKIAKIKVEKGKDSKTTSSGVDQQPPRGIVMPPQALIPPIVTQPNVKPPQSPQMLTMQLQVQI